MDTLKNNVYKPSMFNHFVDDPESGSLILFNSYLGAGNIVNVSQLKKDKIKKWLDNDCVYQEAVKDDGDFIKLSQMGYFVEDSVNEKERRDILLTKLRDDSTLRLVIHTSKACNFRCKYCQINIKKGDTL